MARFSLFTLTIFLVFAAIALSLPTKRDDAQGLTLENAFQGLKTATKSLEGLGDKGATDGQDDQDDQENQAEKTAAADDQAADQDNDKESENDSESKDQENDKPTRTEKKPSSGNFVTPTATHTHHPTSKPNALGKLPIVGGLLGGTGLAL